MGYLLIAGIKKPPCRRSWWNGKNVQNYELFNIMVISRTTGKALIQNVTLTA